MTPQENKRFIRRFVEEVLNRKNLQAIDEFVAEDFVEDVPLPGQGPGAEGLKRAIGGLLAAFGDMHWVLHEQIAEGDSVVSRFTWTGTHQGGFLGIPAGGQRVTVWRVVIDVVRDGRLRESRILMDTAGLLHQLGAIPASAGAA